MSEKPNLRLISSYRETQFPYKFTIALKSEPEDDACLDMGFVNALRLYVSQKINELKIDNYRVFVQEEQMDILFTNSDDCEGFKAAYEDRANGAINLQLKFPGKEEPFQLENILRKFEGLSHLFQLEHEIRFEISERGDSLHMTALNRDAFLTFFQEYEYTQARLPLKQIIDPENMILLLR
ncbi:MAG: hypothetical protein LRY76_07045 [Alphaproteobacteria bacterium]|nr:hypothetical protein [Alphaproteobacteria bacterium]